MPLVNISSAPRQGQQQAFDFSHYHDHLEIVQAINKQMNFNLQVHPLHPAPDKGGNWQRQHQAMHDAMNQALALPQGRDFTGGFHPEWYDANWREHAAARSKLGI